MQPERPKDQTVASRADSTADAPPLVIDLDGTLLRTDLFHESILRLVKINPWAVACIPVWLPRGKAYVKHRVSGLVKLDSATLPFHEELIAWLRLERARGRRIVLATASDRAQAEAVVAQLELFDEIIGSDGIRNLRGHEKLKAIREYLGDQFDYAGDATPDLPLWQASREAILSNPSLPLEIKAKRVANVTKVFRYPANRPKTVLKALRVYQWVKNLLLFIPLVTHRIHQPAVILDVVVAFLAFGFCASSVYVANDLLDLESDRHHANRKNRPFANGSITVRVGVYLTVVCFSAGMLLAFALGGAFPLLLLGYVCLSSLYSYGLKRIPVVDVVTLATLYLVRVAAGHVVTGIEPSLWLVPLTFFLFLSLALSKRAAELIRLRKGGGHLTPGRGYNVDDLGRVFAAGISSGLISALVLVFYINSAGVCILVTQPWARWGLIPVHLYFILRLWLTCWRGQLDDDPILYTAKAKSTYVLLAIALLILAAAMMRR